MTRTDVKPSKWGKNAWKFIDSVVEGYSTENPTGQERREMKKFLGSLGTMLPCHKCRNSFKEYAKQHPISERDTANRKNVAKWLERYKNLHRKATKPKPKPKPTQQP